MAGPSKSFVHLHLPSCIWRHRSAQVVSKWIQVLIVIAQKEREEEGKRGGEIRGLPLEGAGCCI